MTIVEFIEARMVEGQAEALESARAEGTDQHDGAHWETSMDEAVYVRDSNAPVAVGAWEGSISAATARHIARSDPARVLAQVAAMRAIVDEYVELRKHVKAAGHAYSDWIEGKQVPPDAPNLRDGCEPRILEAQERWLRHLAAIWSDHEAYDPAWSPDA